MGAASAAPYFCLALPGLMLSSPRPAMMRMVKSALDHGRHSSDKSVSRQQSSGGSPHGADRRSDPAAGRNLVQEPRSEEHTSELQSLMRISYAVFCLKKKTLTTT